ncbi:hypothetical protein ACFX13_009358 [Malus domestica]
MSWLSRILWLSVCSVQVLYPIWPNTYLLEPRQVESLAIEVMSLKQDIRRLKHENKQLHKLAHNYATNMKRKIDQMQESDGQILLDHQRFMGLFQQHLPSSSGAVPRTEALNDQPLISPPSRALPTAEAPPTTETSPKQPL